MAKLIEAANTQDNNEVIGSFSPIPEGLYPGQLIESEWIENKSGEGRHVLLKFEIIDEGEHYGTWLFDRLNLDHPSPKAVNFATKKANTLAQACGKSNVKDTDELHMIPVLLDVGIEEYNDNMQNVIKKYSKLDSDFSTGTRSPDDDVPF
jgi:hypothetical protein